MHLLGLDYPGGCNKLRWLLNRVTIILRFNSMHVSHCSKSLARALAACVVLVGCLLLLRTPVSFSYHCLLWLLPEWLEEKCVYDGPVCGLWGWVCSVWVGLCCCATCFAGRMGRGKNCIRGLCQAQHWRGSLSVVTGPWVWSQCAIEWAKSHYNEIACFSSLGP